MTNRSLRLALPQDAARISLLAGQVFIHNYAAAGIDEATVREVNQNVGVAAIEHVLAQPQSRIVVAEAGDRLIGFTQWTLDTRHELLPPGRAAEVDRLYVLETATGSGVGRSLLERVERDAAAADCAQLWLTTWIGNARALAFYARRGYRDIGRTRYTFEGESFENRLFVKSLQP